MPNASRNYDLQRFVDAQPTIFEQARVELRAGQKESHWMWFIFPQLRGLGSSPTAKRFALASLDEALAYLLHPTLGPRLLDCTALVNAIQNRTAIAIFGYPDYLKFCSSLTLFAVAVSQSALPPDPAYRVFSDALAKYFDGVADPSTLQLLRVQSYLPLHN